MVLTDIHSGAEQVKAQINKPTSVDVVYAHGGLTGSYSHPATSYEARALGYYGGNKDEQAHAEQIRASARLEGDAYYIIDTAQDLERQWPRVLGGRPDLLKVFLLHSERYEARRESTGEGKGIDPKLLPDIVTRAHAAGLRVSAHVDSAADYRTALAAGVDIMAHLPGYSMVAEDDIRNYELTTEDARETARRNVWVIPTASLSDYISSSVLKDRAQTNQIRNLLLLKAAGVQFGIGADTYGRTALKEALFLNKLGVFSNLELLKFWCEVTPTEIFPQRKIGYLREGYEASFIVLQESPLESFGAVQSILFRFKQGQFLSSLDGK
jgi:hypothetical protein